MPTRRSTGMSSTWSGPLGTTPDVSLGASPRGTLALGTTARAHAAVRGRDFVTPDDVKLMAKPALGHRIVLGPQARLKGRSAVDMP